MASKAKKRSRTSSADTLFAQAQRNLEKGRYKQAHKDAKLCYRKKATEAHRRLLEFALIGRAQDLQRQRNRDACGGIVESLLGLGVTEPAVQAALPDLLLWLGMLDRHPAEQVELAERDRGEWDAKVADQAILHPGSAPRSMPEIREAADHVRQALASLYAGDNAATDLQLRAISRDSPLADWKLFVRGLAGYYEQDFDRMRNNWSRLDSDRVASRIARPLLVIAGEARRDPSDPRLRSAVGKLEEAVGETALSARLSTLQRQLGDGQLRQMLPSLRGICRGLRQIDPAIERRLVRCLYYRVVNDGRIADLERFAKQVDPLPLDPHWNRAMALVRERSKDADRKAPLPFWRRYTQDLADCTELDPARRDLAQALVWLRLARAFGREADAKRHCPCGASHDEECEEAIEAAVTCLEHCFKLAPKHAPAYRALAELHEKAEQPEKVAAAYQRLVQHAPDDFDALRHLAEYYLEEDNPVRAQPFAEQARRAKPLDRQATELMGATHVAAARYYALQGEFDRGRAELQAADALIPERRADYDMLGRKAALETRAGAADAARELIEQAQESLVEPAPLWLVMTIEAVQYELPKEEAWLYEKRWTDALKRRGQGVTAGAMCRLVLAYLETRGARRAWAEYQESLVAYVKRCARVKWRPEDLRDVCVLLMELQELDLLRKYVRKGLKKFRDIAIFHALDGLLEIGRGPSRCNHDKARTSLQAAVELAEQSNDPRDQKAMEFARLSLTLLDELANRPPGGFSDDSYDEE
ncbi:MAG: tetratricopeptide repeat protein [Pirellulaceae bacterium]